MKKKIKIATDVPSNAIDFFINKVEWKNIKTAQKNDFLNQIEKYWHSVPTKIDKTYYNIEVDNIVDERFINYLNLIDYQSINQILLSAIVAGLSTYAKKMNIPLK